MRSLSSNLLKSYFVRQGTEGSKVINSNEVVAQKLERIRKVLPDVDLGSLYASEPQDAGQPQDALAALMGEAGTAGFSEGIEAAPLQTSVQEPVYTGPTPEELVAQAQEEIEQMRRQAQGEIEQLRAQALQSAKQEGYEAGRRQGMQECEALRAQIEEERQALQEAYEAQIERLEPEFIKVLTGIYEKVFEVGLENQKEIILTLLRNTMKKLDGCKNFLIHVSSEDYSYVKEHKAELVTDSTQEGTVIDVVEDGTIRENECTIETINGIYDCGLGTHLSELRKKLTLLSYQGQQES